MAEILLVRHASHGHVGTVLSGRQPGLALTAAGRSEARDLAERLATAGIDRVQTSPVQRARETAAIIAEACALPEPEIVPALDEIDFGAWTGQAFFELEHDPRWRDWNRARAKGQVPGGESMVAARDRTWRHVLSAPAGRTVMVSHCDIIRALAATVAGFSLDRIFEFDVPPTGCVSLLRDGDQLRLAQPTELAA